MQGLKNRISKARSTFATLRGICWNSNTIRRYTKMRLYKTPYIYSYPGAAVWIWDMETQKGRWSHHWWFPKQVPEAHWKIKWQDSNPKGVGIYTYIYICRERQAENWHEETWAITATSCWEGTRRTKKEGGTKNKVTHGGVEANRKNTYRMANVERARAAAANKEMWRRSVDVSCATWHEADRRDKPLPCMLVIVLYTHIVPVLLIIQC